MTSIAIVIPYMVDGVKKYFVHTHSFIPASRVDEHIKTDKVPYDVWISKGLVTVTETLGGIKTDYKYIIKYLEDLIKQNDLKPQLVCYDPHNASAFLSDLEALGFDSVAITQTAKELNDATVDFRLEIKAGNVVIEGTEVGKGKVVPFDELLTWSIANAKTISNSSENIVRRCGQSLQCLSGCSCLCHYRVISLVEFLCMLLQYCSAPVRCRNLSDRKFYSLQSAVWFHLPVLLFRS